MNDTFIYCCTKYQYDRDLNQNYTYMFPPGSFQSFFVMQVD